jgi:ferritin
MLSPKLLDALNDQMSKEFFSGYLYKAMAAYFEDEDLTGFANWMHCQALEELTHGERFYRFINEAGGRSLMLALDTPKNDFASPLEVFEYGLEHERFVTGRINALMDLARDESNYAAAIALEWFVSEQVEEEASFSSWIKKLKMVNRDGRGLLMLDQEAAKRAFSPTALGG